MYMSVYVLGPYTPYIHLEEMPILCCFSDSILSVQFQKLGESPLTREEEGVKMQANPAYLPIEMMSYKSPERVSTAMYQVALLKVHTAV